MKKITLTALALCAFAFTQAQGVKFGAKAGANMSNLTGDIEDTSMKFGFQAGGFVEVKFTDKWALQPEVLYSLQGAKREYSENDGFEAYDYDSKLNLSYINIPVMVKFYPVEKFFLEAGPQVGFLISAKSKTDVSYTSGGTTMSSSETIDEKNTVNTVDFGFNFGLGFDFTENLFANVRYNLGLANVSKEDTVEEIDFEDFSVNSTDYSVRSSVISLSIGYKF